MMFICVLVVVVAVLFAATVDAFGAASSSMATISSRSSVLKMEYIPDGFTKKQWEDLKAKEKVEMDKKKNLGAMGVGKFKSRSFEAWQKAGGKHLFPVDPNNSKYEERPYMQRKGGDWEGNDLKDKGLKGFGQGTASQRLAVDDMYERAQKAGMLNSVSIFGGANLPWTNEDASKINDSKEKPLKFQRGVAGKQLSPEELANLKANLVKPISKQKPIASPTPASAAADASAPKKKGLFGMF